MVILFLFKARIYRCQDLADTCMIGCITFLLKKDNNVSLFGTQLSYSV